MNRLYCKPTQTCRFGLWRTDFLKTNGFDESFKGWGHDDADIVLRLHNAGLQRKNGSWATEVYHLRHKENSLHNEQVNRRLVAQGLHTGLVRALEGVDTARVGKDAKATRLN